MSTSDGHRSEAQKAYQTPTLVEYGALAVMTAGGSTGPQEPANSGMSGGGFGMMRP